MFLAPARPIDDPTTHWELFVADYPPFMNAYGSVSKILEKIKEAQTPDRFTQDFLATKLGFPGGSAKAFIPLAKRLGLLGSDGAPTDLYRSLRNPNESRAAMATAVKRGYPDLYARNEYAHDLDKKRLEGVVTEMTGLPQGHATTRAICGTFEALKRSADFDKPSIQPTNGKRKLEVPAETPITDSDELRLNLSYSINLVLPKTGDVAVFNAIFRSLRENLLRS